MYERLKHPNHLNNGLYGWVIVPASMLDMEASPDAREAKKNIVTDEDGNEVSFELKTMREYLAVCEISNDEQYALCLLNESLSPRQAGVTEADIFFWLEKLAPYGITEEDVLDMEQVRALKQTDNWMKEV